MEEIYQYGFATWEDRKNKVLKRNNKKKENLSFRKYLKTLACEEKITHLKREG